MLRHTGRAERNFICQHGGLAPFRGVVLILSDYRQKNSTTLVACFEGQDGCLNIAGTQHRIVDKSQIGSVFSLYNDITVESINLDVTVRSSPLTH